MSRAGTFEQGKFDFAFAVCEKTENKNKIVFGRKDPIIISLDIGRDDGRSLGVKQLGYKTIFFTHTR